MKKTLAELTASQFIDLMCGDTSVLISKREMANPATLAMVMRDIVIEYKTIVDPGAMKGYFSRIEELLKAKISVVILSICKNLITLKQYDRAKEVLSEYGLSVSRMSEKRLNIEVNSRLARAQQEVQQIEDETKEEKEPDSTDIRNAFDKQTAAMMAHFKFQIDTSTMQATLYAHLVERFSAEIKAQKDASRKK